jgi:hypothetical protein
MKAEDVAATIDLPVQDSGLRKEKLPQRPRLQSDRRLQLHRGGPRQMAQ